LFEGTFVINVTVNDTSNNEDSGLVYIFVTNASNVTIEEDTILKWDWAALMTDGVSPDQICFIFRGSEEYCIDSNTINGRWNLSGTNLFPSDLSNNIGIGTASPTALLDINGSMVLSGGDQNYNFTNRLNTLAIQSQTSGTESLLELYTKDGDGTDELELRIFAVGSPDNVTNREFFQFGYAPIGNTFDIETQASGTGVARDIQIIDNGTVWMTFHAGAGVNVTGNLDVNGNLVASNITIPNNGNITLSGDLFSPTIYDVSSQGLVLAMNFNNGSITGNTVLDSSRENNHGTNNGATHNATDGFDDLGSGAYEFDGVNDFIEISDSNSLNITDAITVSAWINADTFGSFERIVDKNFNQWTFILTNTNPFTGLEFWINGAVRAETSTGVLTADTWHFVVATYDKDLGGTEEVKIYIDGISKATGDFSTAVGTNTDSLDIGRDTLGGTYFDGTIDEVSVWNRALSSDEVKRLYLQRVEFHDSYVSQRDIFVNGSGSVGIGTASPIGRFTIKQGSDNFLQGLTIVDSGSTDRWDLALSGNDLFFGFNSATKVFFEDDGNVGIGTTTPQATLDVESSGTNSQDIIIGASASGERFLVSTDLSDDGYIFIRDSNAVAQVSFRTDGNPSYIAGGGRFGINTTVPTHTLNVVGSANITGDLFVQGQNMTVPDYVFEDEYNLLSLQELEEYIETNKELPSKLQTLDSSINERQYFLLEKIEEIFLYLFGINERVNELEKENDLMKQSLCNLGEVQFC